MLHDSSDDESDRPTIHHAFDIMFSDTGGFPFAAGSSPTSITTLHPPGIQIIQLWQVYVNNVNPLLKISHVPLLQVQIVEAAADPSKASRALEALMFAIYFIAVNSMSDEEVQHKSGESKTILLSRYREATEKALINADFMRLADLTVLQGYFLYLVCSLHQCQSRLPTAAGHFIAIC